MYGDERGDDLFEASILKVFEEGIRFVSLLVELPFQLPSGSDTVMGVLPSLEEVRVLLDQIADGGGFSLLLAYSGKFVG